MKQKEKKSVIPFVQEDEPPVVKPMTPPSGGWGDAEHATELHKNLQPHSCPPEYDSEWGHYRNKGD